MVSVRSIRGKNGQFFDRVHLSHLSKLSEGPHGVVENKFCTFSLIFFLKFFFPGGPRILSAALVVLSSSLTYTKQERHVVKHGILRGCTSVPY